jgi:hypothetical protein
MSTRRAHALVSAIAALCAAACTDGSDPGAAPDGGSAAGPGGRDGAAPGALYAEVEAILARSCAYERCHAGPILGGGLDLTRGRDHHAALVSVTACEYERMDRVEPFAPERSWLMVKLTADFRPPDDPYAYYIHFEPDAAWDPSRRGCPDETEDGTPLFGQRMPLTAPNRLPDSELESVRAWIAAGAPR